MRGKTPPPPPPPRHRILTKVMAFTPSVRDYSSLRYILFPCNAMLLTAYLSQSGVDPTSLVLGSCKGIGRSHKYTMAPQVHCGPTSTLWYGPTSILWSHKYTVVPEVHCGPTSTLWSHKYTMVPQVYCGPTSTLWSHKHTGSTVHS